MNTGKTSNHSSPGPSTSDTRIRRSCKRKISYAEVDDSLLSLIFAEPETVGQGQGTNQPSKRKKTTKSTSVKRPVAADKGDLKQHDRKRKTRSTKNLWLCKKSFLSMANDLKRVSLVDVVSHVLKFLDNEKHIKNNAKRQELLNLLCTTSTINSLTKELFSKLKELMVKNLNAKAKEIHAKYRIKFTFYIRDMMYDKSSKISKWASKNGLKGNDDNFYCVVQAIAAGVFEFVPNQVIRLNKEKKENKHEESDVPKMVNSTESLLVLSGGCFGKIYKCVKRSIINYKRKQNESKWSSQIEFRKFLFQLVMTQNEKRNPNIPVGPGP